MNSSICCLVVEVEKGIAEHHGLFEKNQIPENGFLFVYLHVYHRLLFNSWVNHVWALLVGDGCGSHHDLSHVCGPVVDVIAMCLTSASGDHSSS